MRSYESLVVVGTQVSHREESQEDRYNEGAETESPEAVIAEGRILDELARSMRHCERQCRPADPPVQEL